MRWRLNAFVSSVLLTGITSFTFAGTPPVGVLPSPDWQQADIGTPNLPGRAEAAATATRITAGGEDFGGTRDQGFFLYRAQSGDFDFKVRIVALKNVDVWAKAGLMARETLAPGSRSVAALTTPTLCGSFFNVRTAESGPSANTGYFPANLPNAWLRLKRAGDSFWGFASIDGRAWHSLGSTALPITNTVLIGFAVASHQSNTVTVAEFADYSETGAVATNLVSLPREGIGPSTRRTGLTITEIMYRRSAGGTTENLEFIELFNANPFYEDISGYRLSGDVEYTFPPGTTVSGGAFLVVANNPDECEAAYGLERVLGPYSGSLPREGTVRLRSQTGAVLLEIPYSNRPPWPSAADGTGHSLVLARASYGESNPEAWSHSLFKGGSPGSVDAMPSGPLEQVVINEFLANADEGGADYIELFNRGNESVDISGCSLSDMPGTVRFRIAQSTILPPRGFVVFSQAQLGFGLEAEGETIFLGSPDDRRVLDAIDFGGQARGLSSGRHPDGSDELQFGLSSTPGVANAAPAVPEVIINEIMYRPLSGNSDEEYVELFNRSNQPVALGGWRLSEGVQFEFPPGTQIAPGGYVVIGRNAARLLAVYPNLTRANTFGDFQGELSGRGERIVLLRPETRARSDASPATPVYVTVDAVCYGTGGRWGQWADGGGSSLERIDPDANGRRASNWDDSNEADKAPWTQIEITGPLSAGAGTPDWLQVMLLEAGECLLDNVEVLVEGTSTNLLANPSFDSGIGSWTASGDHVRSGANSIGGFNNSSCLHIRASNQGEPLANHVRTPLRQANLLIPGRQVTLRAQARWLHGSSELILRVKGNYLEAFGRLAVPQNPGTPGVRNSRARSDAGPAIFAVTHLPVLPAVTDSLLVQARVEDRHGLSKVQLNYRIDPSTNYLTADMVDDGTAGDELAGDGVYSGLIPSTGSAALVGFFVEARSAGAAELTARFPEEAPGRECLVRFGEAVPASGFGTYRLWFSSATIKAWNARPVLSNEELDGTFVYGNQRVVYNIGARYSGSPWHQNSYTSPVGGICTYAFSTPGDEPVLGTTSFNKLHALGNTPGDDGSLQREQTAYWMVRQLNLPWNYQRYVQVYVNGQRRGQLMEDTQVPSRDSLRENFPEDSEGQLYKLNGWYEPDSPGGTSFRLASWCNLNKIGDGPNREGQYRWNWAPRATGGKANEFAPVFGLVEAANAPSNDSFEESLTGIADMRQWLRTFAIEHAVGNWDSFGNRNAQNMYAYKPNQGPWKLMVWDFNIVLGNSGSDGPSGDNLFQFYSRDKAMRRIYSNSAFLRTYLNTLQEIAQGPMSNQNVDPVIDARYAAFRASGINASSPAPIKSWISSRRKYLQNFLTNFQASFALTMPTGTTVTTDQNWIALSGIAPVEVATIRVNEREYPISWTNLVQWHITVPLVAPQTTLTLQAYDLQNRPIKDFSATLMADCTAAFQPTRLALNEIMFHPSIPGAQYVEILNLSDRNVVDLTGFRLSGVDYDFPAGRLVWPGEHLAITADRTAFFNAYGSAIAPAGQFNGNLDPGGESLRLIQKGPTPAQDVLIDEVTFSSALPWPAAANEPGVALQLIDPIQDNRYPGNWGAISLQSVTQPRWRFVSVTGQAASSSKLLLYHSPYQPEPDPLDLSGRWDGIIQFPGQNYDMSVYFEQTTNNAWSGEFVDGGSTVPLVVKVNNGTNVTFSFPPNYGSVTWQGRLSPTGAALSGTFSQATPGGTQTAPFSLRRYQDPDFTLGGELYIDDLNLVAGMVPEAGVNLIRNGDFESLAQWNVSSNHLQTTLSTEVKRSGNSSLRLVASRGGADLTTAVWQETGPLVPGEIYTLSYWYLPTSAGNEVTVRTEDNALFSSHSILPPQTATPGTRNSVGDLWSVLPALVLSEIQAVNATGPSDRMGHREPWVELFNPGRTAVSLRNLCLSDSFDAPTRWTFPDNASIAPGEYLIVWLDEATAEGTAAELHANFRPALTSGYILLSLQDSGEVRLLDLLRYSGLGPDQSYGIAGGEPATGQARLLSKPTPGQENLTITALLPVRINEWMASNTRTLLNPASSRGDDWFELYNPNPVAVDLSGFYLTDDLTNPRKFSIPAGTQINAKGFLLVWADERSRLNGASEELHANFKLSQDGELIGLFAPDGSQVDAIVFGPQDSDVSEGPWPDGTTASIYSFHNPTPGRANVADDSPVPPLQIMLASTGSEPGHKRLTWTSEPGQRYQVQFKDSLDEANWADLGSAIVAIDAITSAVDFHLSTSGQCYYRVVRLP